MATSTLVVIRTTGTEYPLPGTHWTPEMAVATLSPVVPGIASMKSTVTEDGDVKVISFAPRTGDKG